MRARACGVAYPACNMYTPYCDVIPQIQTVNGTLIYARQSTGNINKMPFKYFNTTTLIKLRPTPQF